MKKIIIVLSLYSLFGAVVFAQECSPLKTQADSYYAEYASMAQDNPQRQAKYNAYVEAATSYNSCIDSFENLFNAAYEAYTNKNYAMAVSNGKNALSFMPGDQNTKNLIASSLSQLGMDQFNKGQYEASIDYFAHVLEYVPNDFYTLLNIGSAYANMKKHDLGLRFFETALDNARNEQERQDAEENIRKITEDMESRGRVVLNPRLQKNAVTNDTYNYKQYYLSGLNIYAAQASLPRIKKTVTIAVIDDTVSMNHPDLASNIRINTKEIPNNGKDDDGNGFIDDVRGWNFNTNSNSQLVLNEHGTMVAGIIGAVTNNNEGIAGIVPSVKIMSIGVYGEDGYASEENVSRGIQYAIDNGADVINMSMGGNQFTYDNGYNNLLKQAYDKGIVLVAAAGNGEKVGDQGLGIDTTKRPLSPVCNDGSNSAVVIGVGALDENGARSARSNYGSCVDVYSYGEGIISTSVSTGAARNEYAVGQGTSFAAPMIAGIIGLGYNAYGPVRPDIVYTTLLKSHTTNSQGQSIIDAKLYIQNLGNTLNENQILQISGTQNTVSQGVRTRIAKTQTGALLRSGSELQLAVRRMYDNGLTSFRTINGFNAEGYLTREQAAKFFVQFATKVLGKSIPKKGVVLNDLTSADIGLQPFIISANQLGQFNGTNGSFYPFNRLTIAQALAVLIRTSEGKQDESGTKRYKAYYDLADEQGLIHGLGFNYTRLDSTSIKRKDIAIMLYRLGNNKGS